jgi:D-arginine dehydrogenase
MTDHSCDFLVIGCGMAGAAIASHLARQASVLVLEMEDQPGYHSTGRSAALFSENYGNATIRSLSRASRDFLRSPPPGFCEAPLLKPRTVLMFARSSQRAAFEQMLKSAASPAGSLDHVSAQAALELAGILRPEGLLGGLLDRNAADIEVHELHRGYIKALKHRGGAIKLGACVTDLRRDAGKWLVRCGEESFRADVVVNAAGAWAGRVARIAAAQDIQLQPRRRTAALIDPPPGATPERWPFIVDVKEQIYVKPDAGLLLFSPADETPVDPCDAQPEDLDVAIAVERLQSETTLEVHRIRRKWAGLRSFVPDRSPVIGYDHIQPGFFWVAALGGYGIQTAPALSELAAGLALHDRAELRLAELQLSLNDLSPLRLR